MSENSSKHLLNPNYFQYDLNVDNHNYYFLLDLYKRMLTIRLAEYKLAEGRKNKIIGGPVHLGVGQEAVAAGISINLKNTDIVFGAHRSHSHIIALGVNLKSFSLR